MNLDLGMFMLRRYHSTCQNTYDWIERCDVWICIMMETLPKCKYSFKIAELSHPEQREDNLFLEQ